MTRNESFKRRIRERMAQTGEKYGAARRVLIEQAEAARIGRRWASQPETAEASVVEATGHGYDHWVDLIEAWPGSADGHASVASWLAEEHGVDPWWAQAVTVGWERITGRRLPHQMADGTFTAGKTRTIAVEHDELRALLFDEDGRAALFGGIETTMRSRSAGVKVPRIGIGPGVAQIALADKGGGRTTVTVAHEKLPTADDVAHWKAFWEEWLAALEDA